MTLNLFNGQPFNIGNTIGTTSLFTGTGAETEFPADDIYDVGSVLQYSTTLKFLYGGGFTKDLLAGTVTINTAPAFGVAGVIPSATTLTLSGHDQSTVSGIPSGANVEEKSFYLGDTDEINIYGYRKRGSDPGISIIFVNNITGVGFDTTIIEMACCDPSGNALTYQSASAFLYTPSIDQFGTISASGASGATSFTCLAASTFIPGDFLYLNFGNATQEIVKFTGASSTIMSFATAFNYDHYIGETVNASVREFKARQTIPIGSTGGLAQNTYQLSLNVEATQYMRS